MHRRLSALTREKKQHTACATVHYRQSGEIHRRIRLAKDVARIGRTTNAHQTVDEEHKENTPPDSPNRKWVTRSVPGVCARLRENVPCVKVHRYNPKHLYSKLNGYGDNGERKVWSSCGSTYCTCFAYCYSYTANARPSVSQPRQAHSAFIINRCHSYSELQFNTAGYSCAM